jgi:hypothetical protein
MKIFKITSGGENTNNSTKEEEQEVISLSEYKTKDDLHQLFVGKGFRRKSETQIQKDLADRAKPKSLSLHHHGREAMTAKARQQRLELLQERDRERQLAKEAKSKEREILAVVNSPFSTSLTLVYGGAAAVIVVARITVSYLRRGRRTRR